jgi:hypothetical protein
MVADIGLLWWAMRASYRSGRESEHLRLDAEGLELVRIAAHGPVRRTWIEPHWARVELEELGADQNRLWLTAPNPAGSTRVRHGIGAFLSPGERVEIARVIEAGLAADEPVAAAFGPQAAVIGAGVSGDGEGAPEFPSTSRPGCMRVLARQPTASTSSCGSASSRSSGTRPRARRNGGRPSPSQPRSAWRAAIHGSVPR